LKKQLEALNNQDENNMDIRQEEEAKRRPFLLSFICVLSFIGSGMMLFSFGMLGLFHDTFVQMKDMPQLQMEGLDVVLATSPHLYLIGALIYLFSILGVLQIWKLKKTGFHIYTISQFALLFLTSFYLFPGRPIINDILVSASFVFFYAVYLREMS
jgi:hypothetical protein